MVCVSPILLESCARIFLHLFVISSRNSLIAGLYPLLVVQMFSFRLDGSSCCLPFRFTYREPCVPPPHLALATFWKVHLCSAQRVVQRALCYDSRWCGTGLVWGFQPGLKKTFVLRCFVAWVRVRQDYRCVPICLSHSQLEWVEDENIEVASWISSCHTTSLVWPGCLKALKQMVTSPLLPCWGWKHSSVIILKLFIWLLDFLVTTWCDVKHGSY